MRIGVFAAGLLVTGTGAIAAPPGADETAERAATSAPAEQASTEAADTDAAPQEEKKVCRTERATGSLTRRTRVCLTAAQWRDVNARTYKGVTEMQGTASGSQAIVNNPGAGG